MIFVKFSCTERNRFKAHFSGCLILHSDRIHWVHTAQMGKVVWVGVVEGRGSGGMWGWKWGMSMSHRQRRSLGKDAVDESRSRPRRVMSAPSWSRWCARAATRRAGLDEAPRPLSAELISMEHQNRWITPTGSHRCCRRQLVVVVVGLYCDIASCL